MKLTILGNVPSQKNGKRIVKRGSRPILISSENVLIWKQMAVMTLKTAFKGYEITGYPIAVTLIFYFDNLRRHDLDNAAAGVMDALTAAEVIEDDNVKFVDCLTLQYGGHDKINPRVEIFLDD